MTQHQHHERHVPSLQEKKQGIVKECKVGGGWQKHQVGKDPCVPLCACVGFNKGVRASEETDVKESSHTISFMFLEDHYSDKM